METLTDALVACIRACGGSKQVGPLLWPEKAPEAAQRALLDCLNDDRPARLAPDQVLLILRLARAKGFHDGIGFILADLGYTPTAPIEPKDEVAELQRQFIECMGAADRLADRLERLRPQLRAAA